MGNFFPPIQLPAGPKTAYQSVVPVNETEEITMENTVNQNARQ